MATVQPVPLIDRFRGCLLGLAVADAVGSPYEGIDAYGIYSTFGRTIDLVDHPPLDLLQYTDDTEMAIGVAETLVAVGHADYQTLATAFARNYDPRRGYGMGAKRILQAIRDGSDAAKIADTVFPGGSFGNGAAMRVAPIGLFFHNDLDRVDREADASSQVTHRHPLGIDGARLLALSVAMALQPERYDRDAFFLELLARASTDEFRTKIRLIATLGDELSPIRLGDGVEAINSVATAIACFDQNRASFRHTLAAALRVGGDVDTIAAMAGALSGAALGIAAVPQHLLDRLENGVRGRDEIDRLAVQLHRSFTP